MCSNEGILHKCHIRKKSQCETQPYSRTIPLGKHVILENLIGKIERKRSSSSIKDIYPSTIISLSTINKKNGKAEARKDC
jgi:hypothetical protein